MAISQIPPYYRTGTASFNATATVTFQGAGDLRAEVEPGDQIFNRLGQMAVIASVGESSVTLVAPFAGTAQAAQAYTIYRVPDSVRLENFSQRSANLLAGGGLQSLSDRAAQAVADRIAYFTGQNATALAAFTQAARELLDDPTHAAMRDTLGANNAANLTAGLLPNARLPFVGGTADAILSSTGTPPTVASYLARTIFYQKLGPIVFFTLSLRCNVSAVGTGNIRVTGLPFAPLATPGLQSVATSLSDLINGAIVAAVTSSGIAIYNPTLYDRPTSDLRTGVNNYISVSGAYKTAA